MKPRKKNRFLTFVFAFFPGAAEMYMGFMKNGLSILLVFVTPFFLTAILHGADYLAIISAVVYIAAFFHAINIIYTNDEEFNTFKDIYVWEEFGDLKMSAATEKTTRKWIAIALIIVGGGEAWNVITSIVMKTLIGIDEQYRDMINGILTRVPRLVVAILVIILGALLIKGKKKELLDESQSGSDKEL